MNSFWKCIPVAMLLWASACDSETTEREPETAVVPDSVQSAPADDIEPVDIFPELADSDGPDFAHHLEQDFQWIFEPWTGDLPDMIERRVIRALVPWSDTYYYLDGAQQRGMAFEAMVHFEKWLNEEVGSGTVKIHVAILPVRRDQMLQFVAEGRGDLALGGITITEKRAQSVDFTDPSWKQISEWLVESPTAEAVRDIDDLSGRQVHVRASSSYWESLEELNSDFASRGLDAIVLKAVDEYLSTEDLMQMANAGLLPYTVADSELASFWSQALEGIRVRDDIALRQDARYGWAFRKGSPEFEALLNRFVNANKKGTLLGNIVANRYLKDTSRLRNINGLEEQQRMQELRHHFENFSPEYKFDAIMMLSQGFQESRLDQSLKSHRGAVGVMQLLPSTASDPAVGIDDISTAESNILAGIRYMAWIRDTYFNDPDLDGFNKTALAFASYNAGPSRVRRLRNKAEARALDPDVWFDNVELIAAEEIGRETVDYVANIYKYYLAFKLSEQRKAQN